MDVKADTEDGIKSIGKARYQNDDKSFLKYVMRCVDLADKPIYEAVIEIIFLQARRRFVGALELSISKIRKNDCRKLWCKDEWNGFKD